VYAYQEMESLEVHPFDSAFADYLDHWGNRLNHLLHILFGNFRRCLRMELRHQSERGCRDCCLGFGPVNQLSHNGRRFR
jgi:hypothetical protein